MEKEPLDNNDEKAFEYRLKEVSNEEIISILRYREHFKPQAVKDAVKEAIKRGIISSIDDLNRKEFQPQAVQPKSLFPLGATRVYSLAIFKSLCRIFYMFGLIPVVYGIFQFLDHNFLPALAAIFIGIGVMFIVFRLENRVETFYANLLLFFNIPALLFVVYYLITKSNPSKMDIFALLIVVLVLAYTTLYIKKLTAYFNNEEEDF